jgi:DNA-binding NarL/FixJ family response regulator
MTRILLVDDHAIALAGLRSTIEGCLTGATFGDAATPKAALELLERGGWDLLTLDIGLPAPGGLALLQEVRRRWPGLKVLVVSAFAEEELAISCLKHGAAGYVSKSSGAAELRTAVLKVCTGGRYVSPKVAELLADKVALGEAGSAPDLLSPRELQVLRAVAAGRSAKEIAAELDITERTVGTYRSRIAEKLGLRSAVEIVRYALRYRLVE